MNPSIIYRVEIRRLIGDGWRVWRGCTDLSHAEMIATQLRQAPTVSAVRIVAVTALA